MNSTPTINKPTSKIVVTPAYNIALKTVIPKCQAKINAQTVHQSNSVFYKQLRFSLTISLRTLFLGLTVSVLWKQIKNVSVLNKPHTQWWVNKSFRISRPVDSTLLGGKLPNTHNKSIWHRVVVAAVKNVVCM